MSRALLVLLASAILALSGVSNASPLVADCKSQGFTSNAGAGATPATPTAFAAGSNVVLTEGVSFTPFEVSYDVVKLGITVGPSASCSSNQPAGAQIQLGLYEVVAGTTPLTYTLQAKTSTITLSSTDVQSGFTREYPVLFNGLQPLNANGYYYIGFATNNPNLCLEALSDPPQGSYPYPAFSANGLPDSFPANPAYTNTPFMASALVCTGGDVVGDPVFTGLQGQQFTVKGEAGQVFNLISAPNVQFYNRFISLQSDKDSMNATAMKAARASFKHAKLLDLAKADSARPPATTAWNHPGTYMGESGITLGDKQLYIAPGAYLSGFSSVTLDGEAVAISSRAIELDGDITVTRPSAYKVVISTPTVRFTIVNSDNFVNIEHAKVLSADHQLTGLLGQTADAEWEVAQTAEFTQHLENDFKVASNKLF